MDKQQLAQWLVELDENVLQVAIMYAENYLKYGCDVTEKWDTATKQQFSLYRAKREGFDEGKASVVRCKDCKHGQYEEWDNGECVDKTVYCDGYGIHKPDWFCADGKPKDKQLAYADNDTAQYADAPTMMSAT